MVDVQQNTQTLTLSLDEDTAYLVAARVKELKTLFFSDCIEPVTLKTPLNNPKLTLYSSGKTTTVISMQSKLPNSSLRFELKYRKRADADTETSWTVLDIRDNVDRYTLTGLSENAAYVAVGRLQHVESGVWSVFCENFFFNTFQQLTKKPDAQLTKKINSLGQCPSNYKWEKRDVIPDGKTCDTCKGAKTLKTGEFAGGYQCAGGGHWLCGGCLIAG